ncbi:unnamed protein product [Prunus armeniaca]
MNNVNITNKLGEGGFGTLKEGKEIAVKGISSRSGQGIEELGIARGLLYLHHESYLKVIHRDLKVSNILLVDQMNPKISDFGLARIIQGTHNITITHKVVGTLGYMSPEYAMGRIFSEKSDVYSFGVLILEIISSRKNTSFYYYEQLLGFLPYAWHSWNEGRGLELVDEILADSYSSSEVMRCYALASLCTRQYCREANHARCSSIIFSANEATITMIEGR